MNDGPVNDGPAAPDPDAPPPSRHAAGSPSGAGRASDRGTPAHRTGAPRDSAVPRMETVRLTAPDLARRAAMEKTRARLVLASCGFGLLYVAVLGKLALATIISPVEPRRPAAPLVAALVAAEERSAHAADGVINADIAPTVHRATITDRNGQILAISLPTAALYANPREMIDPAKTAHELKLALPSLDEDVVRTRLSTTKQFVYLARQLSPQDELRINALGIPGVYFEQTERRRFPMGRMAAQVLGGDDVDEHGVAGVERFFDKRLTDNPGTPLRLSIDVRVQAVVRDELDKAMQDFTAIGACGIVMDVRTGEVLAMVSLPDYDANDVGKASADDRFNRAVTGMYEPGSTFKLQTAGMALDGGEAHIWDEYDAIHPIHIGRFTITDFEGKHRMLYLPEVLTYSSNLGAAHIAQSVGAERQRDWLRNMGMFNRLKIELPEAGLPIYQPADKWGESTVMTVGFGHGIAVSPLHVVRGVAALVNGGIKLPPTLVAQDETNPTPEGERLMKPETSDMIRKLMRLVVTDGYGKPAEVPGYYVGGKTGTAEKVGAHGYKKHTNVAAFISVFPMNAPRYAVYMMLDEPHATAATHGWATAAWVAAPAAGRVISRIGPMLGLLPDLKDAAEINQALYVPAEPGRPANAGRPIARTTPPSPPASPAMLRTLGPATRVPGTMRHEASFEEPASPAVAPLAVR